MLRYDDGLLNIRLYGYFTLFYDVIYILLFRNGHGAVSSQKNRRLFAIEIWLCGKILTIPWIKLVNYEDIFRIV